MEENESLLDLQVDRDAAQQLTEMSRWGKLMAVLVSIGCGLIFLLIIFVWSKLAAEVTPKDEFDAQTAQFDRILLIVILIGFGVVIGLLMSFLIKGANRIRMGIHNRDQLLFNSGLNCIRNYFAMFGVLSLILLFFKLIAWSVS